MIKMEEFSVNNMEEFERMAESGDIRIAKALVYTIFKNLKGRKRHIPALSVFIEEEELILDVTVDREDFIFVLETNLPKFEQHELYEDCAEILKAVNFLKSKQK